MHDTYGTLHLHEITFVQWSWNKSAHVYMYVYMHVCMSILKQSHVVCMVCMYCIYKVIPVFTVILSTVTNSLQQLRDKSRHHQCKDLYLRQLCWSKYENRICNLLYIGIKGVYCK